VSQALRTLADLVATAAAEMADWPEPENGQVRAVPDERTLRWYGTIGLLDKPLSWRGRTALYGERHLLQVLAVKKLQLGGATVAEIQQRLLGAEDTDLRAVLRGTKSEPVRASTPATSARHAATFWTPAPAVAPVASARQHLDLGHGAELVLPPGLAADPALNDALVSLRAWLARATHT
jgi:DNA-binding transcriptional MerR regulator